MFSVPLICSSSGVATVSAITLGLAPGNCAFTTTDGGTTSGYSEIGNCVIAIRPARKMATEITPAKIGRSIKNFDRFTSAIPLFVFVAPVASAACRTSEMHGDGIAWRNALQTVKD